MAASRKYAALPDLDSAPDVYETPDLTDDLSTLQTSVTARSRSSTSSSYKTLDETDSADAPSGNISHQRLHPSQARNYFSPARVDAQDVDFSDRISSKRRSYKTSSRRRRRRRPDGSGEGEEEELGDFSDEDDDDGEAEEGLKRKIARLRREVEEVKAEVGRRRAERIERGGEGEDEDEEGSGVAGLVDVIDALQLSQDEAGVSAGARLVKQLGKPPPAPLPKTQAPQLELASIHQSHEQPPFASSALSKAASFDTRLTLLERVLGISSGTSLTETDTPRPILPTLELLHRQMLTISESTPASLDTLSRRVKQLTLDSEKLDEARSLAATGSTSPTDPSSPPPSASTIDPATLSKITALHSLLPTIERLTPLLPPLLDRLRSLRSIHADAGRAADALVEAERRQDEMGKEIKTWREGLERMVGVAREGEERLAKNTQVVEGWVGALEERVKRLAG